MAAGNGRTGDAQSEGRPDKHEQVNFQQAHEGAHQRFIENIASAAKSGDNQVAPNDKPLGMQKDGAFNFATPEQISAMSTKDLAKYVGEHDKYVKAQIAEFPQKQDKICASYAARLDDNTLQQTRQNVAEFYDKLSQYT
jgi:hypothetical protein